MSCLSKTWYHRSNSFPYLDFDRRLHGLPWESECQPCKEEVIDKYVNFVGQTLQRFHNLNNWIVIRRLDLPINFRPRLAPFLDSWIELVLQDGVEEFNLYITDTKRPRYNLPPSVFAHPNSMMIKKAAIMGCSLLHSFPINPKPNPNPTNLLMKKLYLHRVVMVETTLSCIISRCPLLEELYILHSMGTINCLRISNLQKLKALVISDWEAGKRSTKQLTTIEIDAPSLQSIHIQVIEGERFKVRMIGYYPILTELTVEYVEVLKLQDILSRLPLLRSLTLFAVPSLTKLKISSDTLNELNIMLCRNLEDLQINAPNEY